MKHGNTLTMTNTSSNRLKRKSIGPTPPGSPTGVSRQRSALSSARVDEETKLNTVDKIVALDNIDPVEDIVSQSTHSIVPGLLPLPPDGGWGWLVVFGSFMIHVFADGVTYSFGVMFSELMRYFNTSKGFTSWIASIMVGVTLGSGPLASGLTNKWGCRPVTVVGAIVAAIGCILSVFSPSVLFLMFSFGIVTGLGFGLMYLPAIVSVTMYFEKRRSFATGIAVCGSGIGTFILAPLMRWLLVQYTWRGTFLILGGLLLNCAAFGLLFRPIDVDVPTEESDCDEVEQEQENSNDKLVIPEITGDIDITPKAHRKIRKESNPVHRYMKHQHVPQSHRKELDLDEIGLVQMVAKSEGYINKLSDDDNLVASRFSLNEPSASRRKRLEATQMDQLFLDDNKHDKRHRHLSPFSRRDVFYTSSVQDMHEYQEAPEEYEARVVNLSREKMDSRNDDEFKNETEDDNTSSPARTLRIMREMLDLSLLADPVYLMFVISNFLTSIGFNAPYIFLPDRATAVGIDDSSGALLVSAIGISNTIGRVVLGFLSDQQWVNRLYLYNISLTICGVFTGFSVLGDSYAWLLAYSVVFGACMGCYVSLTSVILVDLLSLEELTNAFGLLLLFQGIASLIGPPLVGWIADATGSYDMPFIILGVVIALSGVMLFFIPTVKRRARARRRQKSVALSQSNSSHRNGLAAKDEEARQTLVELVPNMA